MGLMEIAVKPLRRRSSGPYINSAIFWLTAFAILVGGGFLLIIVLNTAAVEGWLPAQFIPPTKKFYSVYPVTFYISMIMFNLSAFRMLLYLSRQEPEADAS